MLLVEVIVILSIVKSLVYSLPLLAHVTYMAHVIFSIYTLLLMNKMYNCEHQNFSHILTWYQSLGLGLGTDLI